MSDKLEYNGRVLEDGSLHIVHRQKFDSDLKRFVGKDVEITVCKKRRTRSIPINRYWWGVVVHLIRERFEELGNECSKEDVHEFLKLRYHYKEFVDEKTGEVIKLPLTTTRMTNVEFMELIEKVKEFAATVLDLYIPEPNEDLRLFETENQAA